MTETEETRGSEYLDSGYFYAPYIPLYSTPVVLDPANFVPRIGLPTRYGRRELEDGTALYGTLAFGRDYPEEKVNWKKEGF